MHHDNELRPAAGYRAARIDLIMMLVGFGRFRAGHERLKNRWPRSNRELSTPKLKNLEKMGW